MIILVVFAIAIMVFLAAIGDVILGVIQAVGIGLCIVGAIALVGFVLYGIFYFIRFLVQKIREHRNRGK